ncbi:MAG TPA: enolase C-terminal domain-like protein [Pseudolabrys sp.]
MNFVLGTSAVAVRRAPLLLVDLHTEEGVTGRTYLFCYLTAAAPAIISLLQEVERIVKGEIIVPAELWNKLARRFTLIGVQGIVRMAMSAFDAAAWDALAIAAREPLATFIGGAPRPIPAYNSCGLGLKDDLGALADEADKLLAGGFRAIKLRLGYPTVQEDIAAVHAVRKRIGDDAALMVDYNQALALADARVRGRALDAENIYWLEEPIRHDDYVGAAELARELEVPIQIGENFSLPAAMATAAAQQASDYVMPDLERIGGVTGWRVAADIAQSRQLKMSSHLFPEVSAHLLAATPTCHFLEYVDWANVLLEEPLAIANGQAQVAARPGNGMTWDKKAVERYRLS